MSLGSVRGAAGEGGINRLIYKAVVVEVLTSPHLLESNESQLKKLLKLLEAKSKEDQDEDEDSPDIDPLQAKERIINLPQNSIFVRITEDGKDVDDGGLVKIAKPLLPQHFSLPIKIGETVVVLPPIPGFLESDLFYLGRFPSQSNVQDVNYTHDDRKLSAGATLTLAEKEKLINEKINFLPTFTNGDLEFTQTEDDSTKTEGNPTLSKSPENKDHLKEYDFIINQSQHKNGFRYESVPRFQKRIGDLVLQGSNNTLICLGETRGWATTEADQPAINNQIGNKELLPSQGKSNFAGIPSRGKLTNEVGSTGAIDIVTGRGYDRTVRNILGGTENYKITNLNEKGKFIKNSTLPALIMNERNAIEVDKDVKVNSLKHNPLEGDPDFSGDASRIIIGTSLPIDKAFSSDLRYASRNGGFITAAKEDFSLLEDTEDARFRNGPSIGLKSYHIRIHSKMLENANGDAPLHKGDIRIVKEGFPGSIEGDGLASIILENDGVLTIDSPKIIIGLNQRSDFADENGAGKQVAIGFGATEPMVLGNELKTLLERLIDQIKLITVPTGTGPSGVPINAAAFDPIKTDLIKMLSKIGKLK